jgi:hypothetical protein
MIRLGLGGLVGIGTGIVMGQLGAGAGSRELVTGRGATQEWGLGIRGVGWGRAGPGSGEVR